MILPTSKYYRRRYTKSMRKLGVGTLEGQADAIAGSRVGMVHSSNGWSDRPGTCSACYASRTAAVALRRCFAARSVRPVLPCRARFEKHARAESFVRTGVRHARAVETRSLYHPRSRSRRADHCSMWSLQTCRRVARGRASTPCTPLVLAESDRAHIMFSPWQRSTVSDT
jgi:hypothetical protein